MNNNPKAVNYFQIENINHLPQILLQGEYLFDTGFMPNQFLKAEIYNGKIIITPATPN